MRLDDLSRSSSHTVGNALTRTMSARPMNSAGGMGQGGAAPGPASGAAREQHAHRNQWLGRTLTRRPRGPPRSPTPVSPARKPSFFAGAFLFHNLAAQMMRHDSKIGPWCRNYFNIGQTHIGVGEFRVMGMPGQDLGVPGRNDGRCAATWGARSPAPPFLSLGRMPRLAPAEAQDSFFMLAAPWERAAAKSSPASRARGMPVLGTVCR
jgi:hypothetical protein